MTKALCIATEKGGEGKTTLAIFNASYLAHKKKKRVLIIDLDPQGDASSHYLRMEGDPFQPGNKKYKSPPIHPEHNPSNKDWDGISSSAAILTGDTNLYPYPTKFPNLDILPAFSSLLQEADEVRSNEIQDLVINTLYDFINCDYVQSNYDVIVFDTRPSKGPLTSAALHCSSHLLMPCKLEYFSENGIYGMLGYAEEEQELRPYDRPLNLIGIVPNLVELRTSLHDQTLKALVKSAPEIVLDKIALSKRIKYAELMPYDAKKTEPFELQGSDPAKQEAENMCEYVYKKIFEDSL